MVGKNVMGVWRWVVESEDGVVGIGEVSETGVGFKFAIEHDEDAVTEGFDFGEDMGGEEDGAVFSEAANELADFDDLGGVEADGWFIEDEEFGLVEDGLGEANALAVAFTELADGPSEVIVEVGIVDGLGDKFCLLVGGDLAQIGDHFEVGLDGKFGVEGGVFGEVADLGLDVERVGEDIEAADGDSPLIGLDVTG